MAPETVRSRSADIGRGRLPLSSASMRGYYARHWNFGLPFETKVGAELAEFLSRHDAERDLFLVAYADGDVVGVGHRRPDRRRPAGRASALVHRQRGDAGQGTRRRPSRPRRQLLRRARLRAHLAHHLRRPRRRPRPLRAARLRPDRRGREPTSGAAGCASRSSSAACRLCRADHDDRRAGPDRTKASSPGGWLPRWFSPPLPPPRSSPAISMPRSSRPSPRASASPSSSPSSPSPSPRRSASASR